MTRWKEVTVEIEDGWKKMQREIQMLKNNKDNSDSRFESSFYFIPHFS